VRNLVFVASDLICQRTFSFGDTCRHATAHNCGGTDIAVPYGFTIRKLFALAPDDPILISNLTASFADQRNCIFCAL
jgi:hypothetical protein